MVHWNTLSPLVGADAVFLGKDCEILLDCLSKDILVDMISDSDRSQNRYCDRAILHFDLNNYKHETLLFTPNTDFQI